MAHRRSLFASLLLSVATATVTPLAGAQVSDADRAGARELYVSGVKAQDAGRFAEALDRFQRAQTVYGAPTNLLHIAECQAALGKLIESAETYRSLARLSLGQSAPNAFVQAQEQGKAELTQVEPRIPSIHLVVKPENLSGLDVRIDGQSMSAALVGVERPTNPGTHAITVSAPGYARAEQTIALKEKETRDLTLTLQPAGAPPAVAPSPSPPPYGAPPPYDRPPEYVAPSDQKRATSGIMIGPRVGLLIPGGSFVSGATASDLLGPALSLGLEGGYRFARKFYVGLAFEHGIHGGGTQINALGTSLSNGGTLTTNASSNYLGVDVAYISNPDGVGFYGELGLGARSTSLNFQDAGANSNLTFTGGELTLGVGVHIKVGDWLRLIPKVSGSVGQYTNMSCSGSGTMPASLNCSDYPSGGNGSVSSTDSHSFVFLGATGFFDFARKH